jgi:hypothetical protein
MRLEMGSKLLCRAGGFGKEQASRSPSVEPMDRLQGFTRSSGFLGICSS